MTILVHLKVWYADDFTMGNDWEIHEFPDWRSTSEFLSTLDWEDHESEGGWCDGNGNEGKMTVFSHLRVGVIEHLTEPKPAPRSNRW